MVPTGAYGSWPSPIDAATAVARDGHPDHVGMVGDELWWTLARPTEGGRSALVRRRPDGESEVALPEPWNVRSRLMEYGGTPWHGAARAGEGPLIVFVHFADQRLYAYEPDTGAPPRPLTPLCPVGSGLRWADPRIDVERGEVWCVLEEFTGDAPTDVRRVIAAVPLDGSAAQARSLVRELSDGRHRFVTGPRLSPDGGRAVWIAWDHPRMPWDGTELILADIGEDGLMHGAHAVAGGPDESIAQAEWSAEGQLLFSSDRSGWWNLYAMDPDQGTTTALCPREEEFAGPLWQIGRRWFQPLDNGLIAVVHGKGATALGILDPRGGDLVDAVGPWQQWGATLTAHGSRVVGVAASSRTGAELVELDTATGRARVIGRGHADTVDPAYYPEPVIRTFAGPGGRDVHAHVYPPRHPDRTGPEGERPPYVIWVHGGPTSSFSLVLDLEAAYFTSRGIGVVKVDYGGSTGYGRAYRNRLREQWGVVDVEDCAAVARALAEEGAADPRRIAIRGGSAGGWTAAASLATTDVYACATISYPVLDLAGWLGVTHDFESRYLDTLIGPYADVPGRYLERSPGRKADRVTAPFLLLQGLDDAICPPVQCEEFLEKMAGRGIGHAYLTFEGEGHGFRRSETMIRAIEAELSLYTQVFAIDRHDIPVLELTI
ncbi:prolyl oligopeptidase family serine peptidase [Streptomyces sp. NPDC006660]|uniref:prolyl oligopeptidase family serine peptidase n=1 Tax=Streptomyces sp. NPDC006660 TaxID=3156901 RepID=UPI0033E0311E